MKRQKKAPKAKKKRRSATAPAAVVQGGLKPWPSPY